MCWVCRVLTRCLWVIMSSNASASTLPSGMSEYHRRRRAWKHTLVHTHTHAADAWVAVIKPHMFELFHQPLNPHQPESGTEWENKDLKRKDEESRPVILAAVLSRPLFCLWDASSLSALNIKEKEWGRGKKKSLGHSLGIQSEGIQPVILQREDGNYFNSSPTLSNTHTVCLTPAALTLACFPAQSRCSCFLFSPCITCPAYLKLTLGFKAKDRAQTEDWGREARNAVDAIWGRMR